MIGHRHVTAAALSALLPMGSRAQAAWPNKPIRLIVPYGPGGSADQVARLYGERLSAALGQQVIVEDKPDDLVAVCRLSTALLPITITNAVGAKTWQEFVALARQNPGKYWFGSSGLGTITHLTGEVLTRAAGIKMQHAPYKTIVDATGDIFDGRIQMVFDPSFVPYSKAGKVRTVLVDAKVRLADLPDVPTAQEVGLDLKGFANRAWFGLFAPKGLPNAIAERISTEVARIAATPDMQDKLLLVAQYAHHQSPADFTRQVADDKAYFAALIKELDIKLE